MRVSVIIPDKGGREDWLKEAVESVHAQSVPALEIIIADDLTLSDSDRWNNAIKKSKGEAFIILPNDDKIHPDFIRLTSEKMEKENLHIVATFLENFGNNTGVHGPGQFPFFCSLISREIYDRVGPMDLEVGPMSDVEFWWRCFEAGARWGTLSEPLFLHRVHPAQHSSNCDWQDSRRRVMAKHPNYSW